MRKKLTVILPALIFLFNLSSIQSLAIEDNEVKGGLAICKLIGGKEKVDGVFKVRDNFVKLDNLDRELEVSLEGEINSSSGERSLESEVEISDVDASTFKVGKLLKTQKSKTELFIKIGEEEKEVVIISLDQDEGRNLLTSQVKLRLTAIREQTVSGITEVSFPRTVVLPLNSPTIELIENAEEGTEIDLTDATENGSVVLKCRFMRLPLTLIGN